MKTLKARFLALSGLMVLLAAVLAPVVAEARCPLVQVDCPSGQTRYCSGIQVGGSCIYDEGCLNC